MSIEEAKTIVKDLVSESENQNGEGLKKFFDDFASMKAHDGQGSQQLQKDVTTIRTEIDRLIKEGVLCDMEITPSLSKLKDFLSVNVHNEISISAKLGNNVKLGRNIFIGDETIVGDNVVIEDSVSIENDAYIGRNVKLMKESGVSRGSVIHDDVILGAEASVGLGTEIGEKTTIGKGSTVDGFTTLPSSVGEQCKIGEYVEIRPGTDILDFAELGDESKIGVRAKIGAEAHIGKSVTLGAGAVIDDKTTVQDKTIVPAGELVTQSPDGFENMKVQKLSDKELEKLSKNIAKAVMRNLKLGPEHPAHEFFQKALESNQLEEVIEKANVAIWQTPEHPHVDLVAENGPMRPNSISEKRILLIQTHTGKELAHDDVFLTVVCKH